MNSKLVGASLALSLILTSAALADAQSFAGAEPAARMGAFGGAVAIAGDQVLIGEANNAITPGAVWVFTKSAQGSWTQTGKVTMEGADAADGFGAAIAVDGSTLIATTTGGRAFVFERSGESWSQVGELMPDSLGDRDQFGAQVSLSGNQAFVAAIGQNNRRGAVYVYTREGSDWSLTTKLTGSDLKAGAQFGTAISILGESLMIGAPMQDGATGAVYAFQQEGSSWTETSKFVADGAARNDRFGSAIAQYSGNRVLVGSPRAAGQAGSVAAFASNEDGSGWDEIARLSPFDMPQRASFGASLAVTEQSIFVGAPFVNFQGRAYLFERNEMGAIDRVRAITTSDVAQGDLFATTVTATEDLAVFGMVNADGGAGAVSIWERGPDGWMENGEYFVDEESLAPIVAEQVDCEENAANVFGCDEVDLVSFLPIKAIGGVRGTRLNDVWGWTDPDTNHEYALVGRTDGTSFVDVTDAANPRFLGDLPLTEGAQASSWRDIKVYNNHAYIVADNAANHGMQVFDLTRLRDVEEPQVFEADGLYDRIASAHNIVINEESGFGYSVGSSSGGETCGGGLHMIDLRDAKNPTFAGCFQDMATGRAGTGYSHDAQCVNYRGPDADYEGKEICFGSNETALSIADVSDKSAPVAISNAAYPNVAYAHQGWLTEDHRFFYMNDEGDEAAGSTPNTRTLVWDVTDLDDPQLLKEHMGESTSIDHNLYVKDNLMYQSNYTSGLRILDVSDPENPVEVGHFDTSPWDEDEATFNGSWSNYPFFESGTIVVTSIGEGLFFLKKSTRTVF